MDFTEAIHLFWVICVGYAVAIQLPKLEARVKSLEALLQDHQLTPVENGNTTWRNDYVELNVPPGTVLTAP